MRTTECLAFWIDRSHTNFSCKFRFRALMSHPLGAAVARSPTEASDERRGRDGVHPLGEPRALSCFGIFGTIPFATDHKLPGDACGLVGERNGSNLLRFARHKFLQPRRAMASAVPELANDSCGSTDQIGTQHLVASARDAAQPLSARRGVVFGCQADEGCKIPSRSESVGIADLCGHHHGANWSDRRNVSQPPAHLVAAMLNHQRCLDLSKLSVGMPVLTCQHVEHLTCKLRHGWG